MVLLGRWIPAWQCTWFYTRHTSRGPGSRNASLEEIVRPTAKSRRSSRLREQIDAMLARKQVIESLQGTRPETPCICSTSWLQRPPDGVYLKSVKQTGRQVRVVGLAQSNARVSHFMRNVEASAFLEHPWADRRPGSHPG